VILKEIVHEENLRLLEIGEIEQPGSQTSSVQSVIHSQRRFLYVLAISLAMVTFVSLSRQERAVNEENLASSPLEISAVNEYGELAAHTRKMYGFFDHVVEPLKESTFLIRNGLSGATVTPLFYVFASENHCIRLKPISNICRVVGY